MTAYSNQVLVSGTESTLVMPCSEIGGMALLFNMGEADVYIGPPGVTATTGYELRKGNQVEVELSPINCLHGITKDGKETTVCYLMTCGIQRRT